ncbi:hypothetical protein [Bacillus pinisoli]|uniref:hypothetical protein n=1 Tax=Bacillus pinisoli TaxID=2901866 RepID=UPI001FF4E69E|nr:hypothetical protein [Bacillus pinisoli]
MYYFIGVPLLLVLIIALISDVKRKKLKRSLDHELKGAQEEGEVQFYRDINNVIDHYKNN